MDKSDTIEIHSYLIKDSVLYSLLFLYFLFFLLFFICIIKFKSIKKFFTGQSTDKHYNLLPLFSSNNNNKHGQRVYDKYKYTNLKIKSTTASPYESSTDLSDQTLNYKNLKTKSLISPTASPITSTYSGDSNITSKTFTEKDLITFPSLKLKDEPIKKKSKCGFKFKDKRCFKKDCRKKTLLGKLSCKYFNKLRPLSQKTSSSSSADQADYYNFGDKKQEVQYKSPETSLELNRDKALKCYQDFLENRFCKIDSHEKKRIENKKIDSTTKKDEKSKDNQIKIKNEAISGPIILTPKKLKYEPFKAEIANPVIKPKLVDKNLIKETDKEEDKKKDLFDNQNFQDDYDLENSTYLDLTQNLKNLDYNKNLDLKLKNDLEKKKDDLDLDSKIKDDEDYNFLRLANDIKKNKKTVQNGRLKSPKVYINKLDPKKDFIQFRPTSLDRPRSNLDIDENKVTDDISKSKKIPDINKLYKKRKETGSLEKIIGNDDQLVHKKPSVEDNETKQLKKELDQIKEEKARLLKEQKQQKDKIDELNNLIKIKEESKKTEKEVLVPKNLSQEIKSQMPKSQYELSRPSDQTEKSIKKESDKNTDEIYISDISSLSKNLKTHPKTEKKEVVEINGLEEIDEDVTLFANRMTNEMKNLKSIEFRPLQTIFLKETAENDEVSELRIAKLSSNDKSQSPSLKSEKLFKKNLDLDDILIIGKSDELINLNQLNNQILKVQKEELNDKSNLKEQSFNESKKQESPSKSSGFFSRLNFGNILNLKDKQLENEKSSDKTSSVKTDSQIKVENLINIASIDKQLSKNERYNKLRPFNQDDFEQIGRLEQNKLVLIDKQDSRNEKKSSKVKDTNFK